MKKMWLFAVFAVLILPIVFADTPITVRTHPNMEVSLTILNPSSSYEVIEKFHNINSGASGKVDVLSTAPLSSVNILLLIKKDQVRMHSQTYEGISMAGPVTLTWPEDLVIVDTVIVNETNVTEPETNVSDESNGTVEDVVPEPVEAVDADESDSGAGVPSAVTGNVVSSFGDEYGSILIYGVLGLVIVGAVSFVLSKKMGGDKKRLPPGYNIPDKVPSSPAPRAAASIDEIESRMADLQKELSKLKNRDKIDAAEKKLEQDRQELERLKSEF